MKISCYAPVVRPQLLTVFVIWNFHGKNIVSSYELHMDLI